MREIPSQTPQAANRCESACSETSLRTVTPLDILGIHNSGWCTSAALLKHGQLQAACGEERLNRQKYSKAFPMQAIQYCLDATGTTVEEIQHIAVGWNPAINVTSRYRGSYSDRARYAGEWLYTVPNHLLGRTNWISAKDIIHLEQVVRATNATARIHYVNHHAAHAANAFFLSPFDDAAILTADGYGERASVTLQHGVSDKIETLETLDFPHSIGAFYAAITEFLGFQPDADEWKVMGLASFGDPVRYRTAMNTLLRSTGDWRCELDLSYFNFYNFEIASAFTPKLEGLLGPCRRTDEPLEARHQDIAAAAQMRFEEVLVHMLDYLYNLVPSRFLCLSGGAIMNSVFNGKALRMTPFERLFVSFAPDDCGNSIGAAMYVYHHLLGNPRGQPREIDHAFWGPEWPDDEIEEILRKYKLSYVRLDDREAVAADLLANGRVLGWFQGRMEFGQRALGNRSILADPRKPEMKERINTAVKYRENFRPFAPSVLADRAQEFFDLEDGVHVPFMERVYPVRQEMRHHVPAVVHVDGSGRLHTVSQKANPRFHRLIEEFARRTGVPVVLNTSFNVRGEPIVCSPEDAIRTFYTSAIDELIIGPFWLTKGRRRPLGSTIA